MESAQHVDVSTVTVPVDALLRDDLTPESLEMDAVKQAIRLEIVCLRHMGVTAPLQGARGGCHKVSGVR